MTGVNTIYTEITKEVGPHVMYYNASGGILVGFIFNLYKSAKNYRRIGVFWNN